MGFCVQLLTQTRIRTRFIVQEAHFHTELINASPMLTASKTQKLFTFLQLHSQCEHTLAD